MEAWLTLVGVIITGVSSVIAVVLTNNKSNREVDAKLDKQQAVTDTKLEELTREVRLHNNFAQRIPVIETQMKSANRRIDDLEKKVDHNRGE
nr:MAG TPA: hypothetical protein [Bacteriophage sp.]